MTLLLDSSGLQVNTPAEILTNLRARARSLFGASTRLSAGGLVGDLIDIMRDGFRLLNEAAQDLYSAFDRTTAEGTNLDNLAAVVGVTRRGATRSTCTATLGGTSAATITAGSRVRVPGGSVWTVRDTVTLVGPFPFVATPVVLESEDLGPVLVQANDIDTIVDTVAGWTSVANLTGSASTLGLNAETDTQLRKRVAETAAGNTSSSERTLRQALLDIDGVTHASVTSNRTDTTDSDGVPAHRFRAVIHPSTVDTDLIAQTIWEKQPSGIDSYGSESSTVTDDNGYSQTVRHDWVTERRVYVDLVITSDATYPANGDTQARQAVEAFGAALEPGQDLYAGQIACAVLEAVDGVLDVAVELDFSASPTNVAPLAIGSDELGTIALADVSVS